VFVGAELLMAGHIHSWLGHMQPRPEYPAETRLADFVKQQCAATGYQPRSLALELLADLLEPDPAKRITAQRALRHPYFQQVCLLFPAARLCTLTSFQL